MRLCLCTFLSSSREKYQKRRRVRKKPTVSSLRIHHPTARTTFAMAKAVDRAQGRQDPNTRTDGGAPSARNSPLYFRPRSLLDLSDNGKPWVVAKRAVNRIVGAPPAIRLHGKLRLNSALASFAIKRKRRADKGKGSLRKVPWVLSLSGVLLVLFFRQGKKSTQQTV